MLQIYETKRIVEMVKEIAMQLRKDEIDIEVVNEISGVMIEINSLLYHATKLKFQKDHDFSIQEEYIDWLSELNKNIEIWEKSLQNRSGKKTEAEFWEIYETFLYVSEKEILNSAIQKFKSMPQDVKESYKSLPARYTFLQAVINYEEEDFSLIEQHVKMMVNHIEDYKWLYEHLQDYRSKRVLNGVILYWFTFDLSALHNLCETLFRDYYDMDILACDGNEVLVDLGAYIGDSALQFIDTYGKYKKIYAYEITPDTCVELKKNLSGYPNVIVKQKGAGKQSGIMYVNSDEKSAANKLVEDGNVPVEVVSLDEDITENISIIKIDIEGAEKDALLGARKHIENEKPRLLISSYHIPDDIFDIPKLINSIRDDYKFYMRFNGHNGIWPCDYVLFAV